MVLAMARRERRIVLTNDKDFAELVFARRQASSGVLLLRLRDWNADQKAERLLEVLSDPPELRRAMVVVTSRGLRRRPFPEPD